MSTTLTAATISQVSHFLKDYRDETFKESFFFLSGENLEWGGIIANEKNEELHMFVQISSEDCIPENEEVHVTVADILAAGASNVGVSVE